MHQGVSEGRGEAKSKQAQAVVSRLLVATSYGSFLSPELLLAVRPQPTKELGRMLSEGNISSATSGRLGVHINEAKGHVRVSSRPQGVRAIPKRDGLGLRNTATCSFFFLSLLRQ